MIFETGAAALNRPVAADYSQLADHRAGQPDQSATPAGGFADLFRRIFESHPSAAMKHHGNSDPTQDDCVAPERLVFRRVARRTTGSGYRWWSPKKFA